MEKVKKFFTGIKAEIKKIVWPGAKKTAVGTAAALSVMIASSAVLFGFDKAAESLVTLVLSLF